MVLVYHFQIQVAHYKEISPSSPMSEKNNVLKKIFFNEKIFWVKNEATEINTGFI